MAGGLDCLKVDGKLNPPAATLQNCLKFSHNYKYLSLLCDFGLTTIIELKENTSSIPHGVVLKTLKHDSETLEGHTWSSDDGLYAVLSNKAYIYMVEKNFSLLHSVELYYVPKDISIATDSCKLHDNSNVQTYQAAIAGPNGVEIYHLTLDNLSLSVKEGNHLHNDLAIVLVDFSPDLNYLVVAALDCHFGIWNVKSLDGDQKDFWYKHLPTIRITGMSFSGDSQNIAVACWDGLCYVFTKDSQSSQWCQCSYKLQSSGERICGILTGSLACWSPNNKTMRFSFANEEGAWLSTRDPSNENMSVMKVAEKGIEIKGLETMRSLSRSFSLSFLNLEVLVMTEHDKSAKCPKAHCHRMGS